MKLALLFLAGIYDMQMFYWTDKRAFFIIINTSRQRLLFEYGVL